MANSNLAGLRETLSAGEFSLSAGSGGATTTATSHYYWVNAYSRGGMNLLTALGQVTTAPGQKVTWAVNTKVAGDDVWGWILSANTTNDQTGAKVLCVARARDLSQENEIDPPITIQLTRDTHLALGAVTETLPTGSDLLDGMIRYQGGEYRQYNEQELAWETVNGWSAYISSTTAPLTTGLFKNGCDLPILSNQSIIPLPDYEGGTTPPIRLSILNGLSEGTGAVLPVGTKLALYVRLNGSEELGGQYLTGKIEITPRRTTRRSTGAVTTLSGGTVTWTYGIPFYTLTAQLERGYALEFDVRVAGATLPSGANLIFYIAEYGALSTPAPTGPAGDLVYATGGRLRILPALLGAYRLAGSGVIDVDGTTTSYPISAVATQSYSLGLQNNTAGQKAAISGPGNGSIQFRTGTLLNTEAVRAVVSTEAITAAPSGWVSVGSISAGQSIQVTVGYPCDGAGKGTISDSYPDVIAGNSAGDFNPNLLRVFLRRNGSVITEAPSITISPAPTQIFTISAPGDAATLPTDPGAEYSLWDYSSLSGAVSISASSLLAGTYEVAVAYQYLGNRICSITHAVSDGCIPELASSLAEATELASYYKDLYNSADVLQAKTSGLKFGTGFTMSKVGDKIVVTNAGGGGAGDAATVTVDTTNFDGNLSGTDTTVQAALETIDGLALSETIELSVDTTWHISPSGNSSNDGLTVGAPISLAEAFTRIHRVDPIAPYTTLTLSLANGDYVDPLNTPLIYPSPQIAFWLRIVGSSWVGSLSLPSVRVPLEFRNVLYCSVEDVRLPSVEIYDSYVELYNVAIESTVKIRGTEGYCYVSGEMLLASGGNYEIFNVANGYLDIDGVTFDDGGVARTRTGSNAFVNLDYGGTLGVNSACSVVGSFTGRRVSFAPNTLLDYGAEYLSSLPGTIDPVFPNYIVDPSNELAPVNSPTFTGTPSAPTATTGTNTTQLATTAFVQQELGGVSAVKTRNKESISTTKTLTLTSEYFQYLTPTVASVTVKLPSIGALDRFECEIINLSSTNALVIQDFSGAALVTLANTGDKFRTLYADWDGADWHIWIRGYF